MAHIMAEGSKTRNIRAEAYIYGDVQEAGYRAAVMKFARKMGLTGYLENLLDGRVELVCEGAKDVIEDFLERIRIKTEIIEVEDIEVSWHEAKGGFEGFTVKVTDLGQELFQGYATASKYFTVMFEKQDQMLGKQDQTLEAIKDMHQGLEKDMREMHHDISDVIVDMHQDMNERFDWLGERYGEFGETMRSINEKLDTISQLQQDFHEMKGAFIKLTEYLVNKE